MSTLQGIDQKAVLQATLYGLPMTGFDAPGRAPSTMGPRRPRPDAGSKRHPRARPWACGPTTSRSTPRSAPGDRQTKASPEAEAQGLPGQLTWRTVSTA